MPEDGCPHIDTFVMSGAGSPRYMAPECRKLLAHCLLIAKRYYLLKHSQLQLLFTPVKLEKYNLKADIYSFAIILWEMMSASQPYSFIKSRHQLIKHVGKKVLRTR